MNVRALTIPGTTPESSQTMTPESQAQTQSSSNTTSSSEAEKQSPTSQNPVAIHITTTNQPEQIPIVQPSPVPVSSSGSIQIGTIILNTPALHTFQVALRKANLAYLLLSTGPYTVFAPNNSAFKRMLPGQLTFLFGLNNRNRLEAILTYHIVHGTFMAADLVDIRLETLQGQSIYVSTRGTDIFVNNAKIVQTNIIGSNGVMHIIDNVLLP